MASPFPGIDPYLESQGRWPDFHARFITYCCDQLSEHLPQNYVAQMDERITLVESATEARRVIKPDLAITREDSPSRPAQGPSSTRSLEPVTIPLMTVLVEEIRETWIEIIRLPERELVTVIEILSPTNKCEPGRSDYLAKRIELIAQPINLVELDFLLGGHRLPMRRSLPQGDFYALISPTDRRPNSDVFAWSIRQELPTLPVPLKAPDAEIPLDLARAFATAYERGQYFRLIAYDRALGLPLAPDDRIWAEEQAQSSIR